MTSKKPIEISDDDESGDVPEVITSTSDKMRWWYGSSTMEVDDLLGSWCGDKDWAAGKTVVFVMPGGTSFSKSKKIKAEGLLCVVDMSNNHFWSYCVDWEKQVIGYFGTRREPSRVRKWIVENLESTVDMHTFKCAPRSGFPYRQVESECGALACLYAAWFVNERPKKLKAGVAAARAAERMEVWRSQR